MAYDYGSNGHSYMTFTGAVGLEYGGGLNYASEVPEAGRHVVGDIGVEADGVGLGAGFKGAEVEAQVGPFLLSTNVQSFHSFFHSFHTSWTFSKEMGFKVGGKLGYSFETEV